MKGLRVQSKSAAGIPYSASNPAPSSAIQLINDLAKPSVSQPGQIVVQVKATTVIRDNLTWPELYDDHHSQLGNDFAGVVVETHATEQEFRPGDKVYGMSNAKSGGAWAEYILVSSAEAHIKPDSLSWEEAAALPLSALTADQALFTHGRLEIHTVGAKRVLITGAAGGVGVFLVQFAAAAGHYIVAATSSNSRNEQYLRSLGAREAVEYASLTSLDDFDVIIDAVGGKTLAACWSVIKDKGTLISIDSASYNFIEDHKAKGFAKGKEEVPAIWFVVEPSRDSMTRISKAVSAQGVKGLVAKTLPLAEAREAYDLCESGGAGRGKIVLVP